MSSWRECTLGAYWRDHLWPNERRSLASEWGALNASVGAGLLSRKTLAKADFFTGKLHLRSFGRCVCVSQGVGSPQAVAHFLPKRSLHLSHCSRYTCKRANKHSEQTHAHTASVRAITLRRLAVQLLTHTRTHSFHPHHKSLGNRMPRPPALALLPRTVCAWELQTRQLHNTFPNWTFTEMCLKIC